MDGPSVQMVRDRIRSNFGSRVAISTRSIVDAIAMAIRGKTSSLGIRVNGVGLDLEEWRARYRQRFTHPQRQSAEAASEL
jgi:hypothetical protein